MQAASTHAFEGSASSVSRQPDLQLTAALGVMWAHAVNTRLVLESVADVRYIKVRHSLLPSCKYASRTCSHNPCSRQHKLTCHFMKQQLRILLAGHLKRKLWLPGQCCSLLQHSACSWCRQPLCELRMMNEIVMLLSLIETAEHLRFFHSNIARTICLLVCAW